MIQRPLVIVVVDLNGNVTRIPFDKIDLWLERPDGGTEVHITGERSFDVSTPAVEIDRQVVGRTLAPKVARSRKPR